METIFNHIEVFKSELCGLYSCIFLQMLFKYEIFLHLCTIIRFYEALLKYDLNHRMQITFVGIHCIFD